MERSLLLKQSDFIREIQTQNIIMCFISFVLGHQLNTLFYVDYFANLLFVDSYSVAICIV